ncbi:adhesion G protein-coupled receptor L4-like [Apostichopus japonicus]|uniref:adhesion G protein-coupled receptor L4-like n=1 Tax=Stichopus japonicus TaxID=307972 RepID=UPI003AB73572
MKIFEDEKASFPWKVRSPLVCIIGFVLLLILKNSDALEKVACERYQLIISCEVGVIKIEYALYGRDNIFTCPPAFKKCASTPSALNITRKKCEKKTDCSVFAHNNVYGDPCSGVSKFLRVQYTCLELNCTNFGDRCSENETCKDVDGDIQCLCPDNFMRDENGVCSEIRVRTTEEIYKMNITETNVVFILTSLSLASDYPNFTSMEILRFLVEIFESIVQLNAVSDEITTALVQITNDVMNINPDILEAVPEIGRIPLLLEQYAMNIQEEGKNVTVTVDNVALFATLVSPSTLRQKLTFFDMYNVVDVHNATENDRGLTDATIGLMTGDLMEFNVTSSITMPDSVLIKIQKDIGNVSAIPLSFIIFNDASLFPMTSVTEDLEINGEDFMIKTQVISASVGEETVTLDDLPESDPVIIRLRLFIEENVTLGSLERKCVYWRYNDVTRLGEWATNGCRDVTKSGDTHVTCHCNHLTSFAVFVRVTTDDYTAPPFAIDVITNIGCVISILGLIVCILTGVCIKSARKKQLTQVHVNLSLALVAMYITFLLGVDATSNARNCKIIATLIHFFCLLSMAWMSVEAFNMFMFLWLVKRNKIKHLVSFGMAYAWGISLSAAILVFFLDSHDYEINTDYCFLHPGVPFYFGFLAPIFLLFSFNAVVFILITYRVSCRNIIFSEGKAKRKAELARIKGPILFWILLGLSWIFGFLSVATTSTILGVVFSALFSIFLASQGIFMFYVLAVNNPEISETFGRFKTFFVKPYATHTTMVRTSHTTSNDTSNKKEENV